MTLSLHRLGAALAVATVGALAAFQVYSQGKPATAAASAMPPVSVDVAEVVRADVETWDEYSGRLEAIERVDLRPRVAGAVLAVHFREGALVRAGDLLVTLDPAPYAAEVQRAEAQVAGAVARERHQQVEFDRAQRLWRDQAISQRELEERRDALAEASAALAAARAGLVAAQLNLSYTQVRAPVAGRVGRADITVGNLVAAGASSPVLTTLVSVHPIDATFDADEGAVQRALQDVTQSDIDKGRLGGIPIELQTAGPGGRRIHGVLQRIDNQVNARSGTVRLSARFDNTDGRLLPGQFARLRLGRATHAEGLLVPEKAVASDQDRKFVWVVGGDNRAAYREVALGRSWDGLRVVTAGLKPGERVVVAGLQRVKPGAVVQPHSVPLRETAASAATPAL